MAYVDNQVPFGSRTELLMRAGVSQGTYIFENINLKRPSKVIERPDEIGEPNGFVAVRGFQTGTAVVQIPTADSEFPRVGDYIEDTFSTGAVERWVVTDVDEVYEMNSYYKTNISLRLSINPPA